MTLEQLTTYYQSLLAYQYRSQPKASQQIELWAKQAVGDFLASSLSTCFILATAVGEQLDILGKYIGVARNIGTGVPQSYFGLWTYGSTFLQSNYQGVWNPAGNSPALPSPTGLTGKWYAIQVGGTAIVPPSSDFSPGDIVWSNGSAWLKATTDNANGFTTYADYTVNANAQTYSYSSEGRNVTDLTDSDYKQVLQFQIIRNASDHTLASIMAAINTVFPGMIGLVDNTDMTLSYTVSAAFPLSTALLTQFLPKPMGVGITVTIVTPGEDGFLLTEDGGFLLTEDGGRIIL